MTTITIMPSGKTVDAAEGDSLLSAIIASGEKVAHKGAADEACDQCHIFVLEGRKGVSKITREENEILDSLVGVGSKSRLACHAKVLGTEDITVEVLSFV